MLTEIQIVISLGLAAAALVAAWPLLRLPLVRRTLAGVSGAGLVAAGATTFGLAAGGFFELPALAAQASAQEPQTPEADETPAADASSTSASSASAAGSGEVAIGSIPEFVAPAGRPAWIHARENLAGPIHTIPVASGAHHVESEARRALDRALESATSEYIEKELGSHLAPQLLRFDARTIKERFVKPQNVHSDWATYQVGEMCEYFALLEFDQAFRDELASRWDAVRSTSRLTQLGLFAGAGLLLLAAVFGYFRLDNATRGYYTGRLQFLAAAAILAVIGAGVFAAQWIHWL
jgi:hypothetical protein